MTSTLPRWLAGRTPDGLAEILGRRAEALSAPVPRDLGEVASRLQAPGHLINVLHDLPQPCLELLETLLVFGPASRTRLAAIIGVDVDDPTFDAALRVCELWVVAWEYEQTWYVSGALRTLLPTPLRLGPPIADLLNPRTVDDLRSRATAIGLAVGARKVDIVHALSGFYADGDSVRKLYQAAPSAQRELLLEAAWHNPVLRYEGAYLYTGRPDPAISWLLTHGLAVADWQQIVVPREVALAIRGDDWRPPLTRRPELATLTNLTTQDVTTQDVTTQDVDRDAAAAAGAAVDHVAALLDAAGATPVALLKAGGIGVKEIRRLAKATGVDEPSVRLWLEIAYAAGLCDVADDGDGELLPSTAYDDWLAGDPADQLVTIIEAWRELDTVPLIDARPDGVAARAVLADDVYGAVAARLRMDVLAVAAEAGRAITSLDEIVTMVIWRRPLICAALRDPALAVGPIRAEAHLLGLFGRDALSSLGAAMIGRSTAGRSTAGRSTADEPTADRPARADQARSGLAEVARRFVRAPATEAIFQADLTVVVAGSPSAQVSALLDAIADRESRGAATTWRCSPASVRRALDAGQGADELLTSLRAIAAGGTLPQPLEYLVADVARRHGELRVRSVGCVLRCDDPVLLAEIVATRSLTSLRLSTIAPTVLASTASPNATLAALRSAGYAPVGEGTDGMPLVERAARRRSSIHVPDQRLPRARASADPRALAAALLAVPLRDAAAPPHLVLVGTPPAGRRDPHRSSTMDQLIRYARRLGSAELRMLADAIDEGHPVQIRYTSASGATSTRVIEPIELDGDTLVAWCQLRDDERNFLLGRIDEVAPG